MISSPVLHTKVVNAFSHRSPVDNAASVIAEARIRVILWGRTISATNFKYKALVSHIVL
jgi:hypothetical protein